MSRAKPVNLEIVKSNNKIVPKKRFTSSDLIPFRPLTHNQSLLCDSIERKTPITIASGTAGTGKTMAALAKALELSLDTSSEFDRVYLVRSAVDARSIGYIKGDQDEKEEVYQRPYPGIFDQLIYGHNPQRESGLSVYEYMKSCNQVKFITTSFMRGITLDRCVVVVDEFQTMDIDELRTVVTRLGEHAIIIFCGDIRQDDLKRKREKSGLPHFLKIVNEMGSEYYNLIDFTVEDIVRSGIVKQFIIADESITI